MEFAQIGRNVGRFINRNSTTILTSTAVVGTISTAILTGRAAREQGIDEEVYGYPKDWKERVQKNWKRYIPAVSVGGLTIGCIIGVNTIGMRRTAALASVATMTERALVEYQDKVRTLMGDKKADEVESEIAKDRLAKTPVGNSVVIGTGKGEHLCFEAMSGRYFYSDIEQVRKTENDVNALLIHGQDTVSQNEWYEMLGLPRVLDGDTIGWNDERLMELKIDAHLAEDNTPCIYVGQRMLPSGDFWRASR